MLRDAILRFNEAFRMGFLRSEADRIGSALGADGATAFSIPAGWYPSWTLNATRQRHLASVEILETIHLGEGLCTVAEYALFLRALREEEGSILNLPLQREAGWRLVSLEAEYFGGPRYMLEAMPRSLRVMEIAEQLATEVRRDVFRDDEALAQTLEVEHLLEGERRLLDSAETLFQAGLRNGDVVVVTPRLCRIFVRAYSAEALHSDAFRCGLPPHTVPRGSDSTAYVKRVLFELDRRMALFDLLALALIRWPTEPELRHELADLAQSSPNSVGPEHMAPHVWPLLRRRDREFLDILWRETRG